MLEWQFSAKKMTKNKKPSNEELAIICKVAKRLAPKYVFGFYEVEDIEQEAIIFGLSAMSDFDGRRPLENFMSVCIGNALKNFKRKNYVRLGERQINSEAKKNLIEPIPIHLVRDEEELSSTAENGVTIDDVYTKDVFTLIDRCLPYELRSDYLRLKHGLKIPKCRREKVEQSILEILEQNHHECP